MCSASTDEQKQRLTQLLDEPLDEREQIACLRQLRLEDTGPEILEYAALRLRERMIAVPETDPCLVDLCGTGGDKSGSFNISTTAALVVAGAGYRVAKHGNVSITSKSGSIDLLRALNIPLPETPGEALAQSRQTGITFLFAPYYHPTFRKFASARKILAAEGTRTIFNLLGPLLNPAGVKRSLTGVFDPCFTLPLATVLRNTGTEKALVVHGDGMDEMSLTGANHVCEINAGKIICHTWNSSDFDLPACAGQELAGGTPAENAATTQALLDGTLTDARKDMVILNAGAAIYAADDDPGLTLRQAITLARASLENGKALAILESLRA